MEEAIPSLSSGVIGSRFVSQDDIESAKSKREEQWKAAYARLGQEPPPQQVEDSYDGRSLAEKLAANKIAKQEEYEEKTKLANQFRALEEDEIMFLDSIREKEMEEERQRKQLDGEEVKNFKEAVAARTSASNPPPISTKPVAAPPTLQATAPKKDVKKGLKGVIVKKKGKPAPIAKPPPAKEVLANDRKREPPTGEDVSQNSQEPQSKRRRVSES
ncbi:N-terminal domain of NEFA-interacting nuclear protein NIP30-domain-containing protein [Desarmillaria tabescens]|uniref:N-terminal domain of NEFA-interacting nuclear protein NIP30-domain-containing protein n=1 Tax=Armillaria tabescens TaxID=1929756 RepID=A0AA39T523_ARMTA|nr:N-terminal domain of NEFA-interacting nuclear protein NIP30-domain-containing protein [Desarmillaria tabescens]KAK0465191.1 N-terminal domain of NEFA-interacting nuclear protein NIP30-domain-containing protein [Desarmillaria tabescens]